METCISLDSPEQVGGRRVVALKKKEKGGGQICFSLRTTEKKKMVTLRIKGRRGKTNYNRCIWTWPKRMRKT